MFQLASNWLPSAFRPKFRISNWLPSAFQLASNWLPTGVFQPPPFRGGGWNNLSLARWSLHQLLRSTRIAGRAGPSRHQTYTVRSSVFLSQLRGAAGVQRGCPCNGTVQRNISRQEIDHG
jgi:hypothetical protein